MYYLLEDNRIIDESKALHNVDKIIIEEKENKKYLYLVGWLGKHFCGKIKNQSENVFDLIKVGDLVRYEDDFLGTTLLAEVYMNYGKLSLFDETDIKNLDIIAIYKLNSKGDYIKVWEKKDGRNN